MRWAAFLVVVGCGFTVVPPSGTPDAPPDVPPDVPPDIPETWLIDGTSGKAVPTTTAQWIELIAARSLGVTAPTSVWLMQEPNGTLGDAIGGVTLSPLNLPTYTNPVPGWSRVAVGTNDTTQNQGFRSLATGNLNGTSYLFLLYVAINAPASADRAVCAIGENGDYRYVALTSTNRYQANGIGVTPVTSVLSAGTTVHPVILKINGTMSQFIVYTDQEKLATTWVGTSGIGNNLVVGNGAFGSTQTRYLYGALWSGAGAEMSDAQIKAMLQAMGWSVTGY